MNRNSVIFRLQDDNPQALQSVKQVVAYLALAGIAVTDLTSAGRRSNLDPDTRAYFARVHRLRHVDTESK